MLRQMLLIINIILCINPCLLLIMLSSATLTVAILLRITKGSPSQRMCWYPSGRVMGVDYEKIITVEPGKRGGRPTVRGMRITVYDVLSYLAAGMSHKEILEDFPYLTEDDILACLAYAADRERRTLAASG
jgi:uncharacterized protein (DUF433 family)